MLGFHTIPQMSLSSRCLSLNPISPPSPHLILPFAFHYASSPPIKSILSPSLGDLSYIPPVLSSTPDLPMSMDYSLVIIHLVAEIHI